MLTLARAYGMAINIDWRPLGRIVVHVALFSLFAAMLLPWALAVPVLGWKVLFGLFFGGECAHPPDLLSDTTPSACACAHDARTRRAVRSTRAFCHCAADR